MRRTAAQLAATIRQIAKMDLAELGADSTTQTSRIFDFMSLAMQKFAKIANQRAISDPLLISGDGNVAFKVAEADITDFFQADIIVDSAGNVVQERKSFTSPIGWFSGGENQPIHVKNLPIGEYTLHYIKYPAWVSSDAQIPEFPPSGYYALIFETVSLIKQSKNFYEEADASIKTAKDNYSGILSPSEK